MKGIRPFGARGRLFSPIGLFLAETCSWGKVGPENTILTLKQLEKRALGAKRAIRRFAQVGKSLDF